MSEHTQGPVTLDMMKDFEDGTDIPLLDARGFPIATIEAHPILHDWSEKTEYEHWARGADSGETLCERPRPEYEANARRIHALWNACQSIPTETLEAGVVEEMVGAVQEARPVVANAAANPDASPWQVEIRSEILTRIDAILAKVRS